jgi:hypothetical protein
VKVTGSVAVWPIVKGPKSSGGAVMTGSTGAPKPRT